MSARPWIHRVLRRAARTVRFGLLTLAAMLASVALSYTVVRHMTRNVTMLQQLPRETVDFARQTRAACNTLAELANELAFRVPPHAPAPNQDALAWMRGPFQVRLRALQQQLGSNTAWPKGSATALTKNLHARLAAAADRAAALAARPEDNALRKRALTDIRDAVHAAETWLLESGAARHMPAPRIPLSTQAAGQ